MEKQNLSFLEIIKTISLLVIATCSIILVVQGFGAGTQDVYVVGGDIDAEVSGTVDVDNAVEVYGGVEVRNVVDVDVL